MGNFTKLYRAIVSSGAPGLNESGLNQSTLKSVRLVSVLALVALGLLYIVYAMRI